MPTARAVQNHWGSQMLSRLMMLFSLLSLSASVGCGGKGGDPCRTPCTEGATRCSGTQVQTCARDTNQCLVFGPSSNCSAGQTCSNNACVDVCTLDVNKTPCANASAKFASCCGGTETAQTGDQLCHSYVAQGRDPATSCATLAGMSCTDLHASELSGGRCCCPANQACDYTASLACAPRCNRNSDCTTDPSRPACAPGIATVSGTVAIIGPYICLPDDGNPGHGCNTTFCSGAAYHCATDSRGNQFCTTYCTGDAACGNPGTACCNVARFGTPACGLCGSP